MQFFHPRYWPIWFIYTCLRVISFLPYTSQLFLGRIIGSVFKKTSKKRKKIAETNIRLCFPAWDDNQRKRLLDQHFESLGICLLEFGMSWWWSEKRIRALSHVEGLENLENALEKNRGVILLAGHFTTLEIISRVLRLHTVFHPMYRKNNNKLIEFIISSERKKHCGKVIPHDNPRLMIKSLRSNIPVLYIPDQNFGLKYSIFVPFFGIPTATVSATSRLAAIDNTPVVPIIQQRLPGSRGYRLVFLKALDNFPSEDIEQDTIRLNRLVEDQVLQSPSEYLWVHRRFKTRPPGEASFYN